MLERPELAAVVFGAGLVIALVGFIGIGGSSTVDYALAGVGVVIGIAGAVWWRMLRTRMR